MKVPTSTASRGRTAETSIERNMPLVPGDLHAGHAAEFPVASDSDCVHIVAGGGVGQHVVVQGLVQEEGTVVGHDRCSSPAVQRLSVPLRSTRPGRARVNVPALDDRDAGHQHLVDAEAPGVEAGGAARQVGAHGDGSESTAARR